MKDIRKHITNAAEKKSILKRFTMWLDASCARREPQDSHAWPAKQEILRRLKQTKERTPR